MRSRHIPMSVEEFLALPRQPGWKHEYYGGEAHITPRDTAVDCRMAVAPRAVPGTWDLRPIEPKDQAGLVAAFFAAFHDTVEFCDWEPAKILAFAGEAVAGSLAGKRGTFLPASRLTVEADGKSLAGAAMVIDLAEGAAMLDLLFVTPERQGKGLATALVAAVLNELEACGYRELESRYHLANDASRTWHRRFGFQDLDPPDALRRERARGVSESLL